MASKQNRKLRQQEAAARQAAIRREYERRERRRRMVWVGAVVAVLVVIIGSVAFTLMRNAAETKQNAKGPVGGGGLVDGVGILHGNPSAPVTVTLYEDFQCPVCKAFEQSDNATLQQYVKGGKIKVDYRPVAFLNTYSTDALNAAACVYQDSGRKAYLAMHDLLYANQPPESGPYPPKSELVGLATQAGASTSVSACIDNGAYDAWASKSTDAWNKAGYSGTPTVLVDGKDISAGRVPSPAQLKRAIDDALAAK